MDLAPYIRVSTDEQKTGLQVYRESVLMFAERNKYNVPVIYEDEDVSGGLAFRKRPEGRKVWEAAVEGRIKGILSDNVSRMFRDMEDGIVTANRLKEMNIKLFFVDYGSTPIDIQTESGFLWFVMQLTMAHIERMKIQKRTKDAHRIRRKNGLATSHTPYGKDKIEGGRLIDNPCEMSIVRKIVSMRDSGCTFQSIADHLNHDKVPTKKGREWDKKTVSNTYNFHTLVQ